MHATEQTHACVAPHACHVRACACIDPDLSLRVAEHVDEAPHVFVLVVWRPECRPISNFEQRQVHGAARVDD
eukprot:364031-Chlamydomonas_euryale.AAC.2